MHQHDKYLLFKEILNTRKKKFFILFVSILVLPAIEVFQLIVFTQLTSGLIGDEAESFGFLDIIFLNWIEAFANFNIGSLPALGILLGLVAVLSTFTGIAASYLRSRMTYSIKAFIQYRLFKMQLMHNWITHTKTDRGFQFQIIKDEPGRMAAGLINPIFETAAQLVLGIAVITYSAITIPALTLMAVSLFMLLFVGVYFITGSSLDHFNKEAHRLGTKTFRRMGNALNSFKENKLYSLESTILKLFYNDLQGLTRAAIFQSSLSKASRYLLEGTAFVTLASIISLTFLLNLTTENLLQSLAIFAVCLLKLVPIFNAVFGSYSLVRSNLSAYAVVNREFNIEKNTESNSTNYAEEQIKNFKDIELKGISFKYDNQQILNNLNLKIEKGCSYGIVGPSGSGKTTVIDILSGLIKPDKGTIFINGKETTIYNNKFWKKNIGTVIQDVFVFNGTLRNNIIFSFDDDMQQSYSDEELIEICKKTALFDVINARNGLDTIVGDAGVQLSGGQKQRLGMARALYRNASIMIFDEATSALDSETEKSILETIDSIDDDITTIQIAHRVQTLKNMDKIFIIDNKGLADSGSYEDLKNSNELFRKLGGI